MKYVILTALALFVPSAVVLAQDVTKEDVVKLSKAGLGDQVIIEFLRTRNTRIALAASDVVDLKAAGVADSVVKWMLASPTKEQSGTNGGCGVTETRSPAVTVQPTVVTTPAYSGGPYSYDGYYGYGYPYYGYYGYGYPYRYGYHYYPYSYSHVYTRPWHYGYGSYGHGTYGSHGYSSHGGGYGGGHSSGGGHSGGGHR